MSQSDREEEEQNFTKDLSSVLEEFNKIRRNLEVDNQLEPKAREFALKHVRKQIEFTEKTIEQVHLGKYKDIKMEKASFFERVYQTFNVVNWITKVSEWAEDNFGFDVDLGELFAEIFKQ